METMKAIAKRKSTRAFNPEKGIAKADLDAILAAGCAAPVGAGDYSSLHLTIIQSKEMLDKINKAVQAAFKMDRDVLYGAPVLVLVSSSEPKFPNIQYANVGCVMEKELGIPEGFTPISGAALGYAAESSSAEKELGITLAANYVS